MKKIFAKLFIVAILFILTQCQAFKKPVYYETPQESIRLKVPVIRVGLLDLPEIVEISSEKGLKIIKKQNGEIQLNNKIEKIVIEKRGNNLREIFYVQIGAFLRQENAKNFINHWSPFFPFQLNIAQTSQFYQVRIGPFSSRSEAFEVLNYSIKKGLKDSWIVVEKSAPEKEENYIFIENERIKFEKNLEIFLLPLSEKNLIKINGIPYRGIIRIKYSKEGLLFINTLNLEDYLKGVVPLEMNPEQFDQIEALKAQAVAARTFAIRYLTNQAENDYDICSTTKCQVYRGSYFEHPLSNKAVEETENEILVWKGLPINALYTGSCGGYTENAENIFGGEPIEYLRGTYCFHEKDKVSPLEWVEEKRKDEIEKIIRREYSIGEIVDIYPLRRGVSGKIVELRILSTENQLDIRGYNAKGLFGLEDLPTEILKETSQENKIEKFIFKGRGRGHGVGMCQEGSFIMAKMKRNYKEILLHYYKDVDILNWKEEKNEFGSSN